MRNLYFLPTHDIVFDVPMKPSLTKSETKAHLKRWAVVNALEREELRRMPMSEKIKQFLALTAAIQLFGVYTKKTSESKLTQKRWQMLRRRLQSAR